jgi:hypothetical protein
MPITPSPDEQRMTPEPQCPKAHHIPKFRRVETFLWRCLIDSSISIVGHPYPPSDYWDAVLSGSIRAEARRGLREIERHLRANQRVLPPRTSVISWFSRVASDLHRGAARKASRRADRHTHTWE